MSIAGYAIVSGLRSEADEDVSVSTAPPGVGVYVDALSALVPAEVLIAHAAIMSKATTTTVKDEATEEVVTTVVPSPAFGWIYLALIVLSLILYVSVRKARSTWANLDYFRMFLPPLAFIGWTMGERVTLFDATFPTFDGLARFGIVVVGALAIGAVASFLGWSQNKAPTVP